MSSPPPPKSLPRSSILLRLTLVAGFLVALFNVFATRQSFQQMQVIHSEKPVSRQELLDALYELSQLPIAEKRESLLFIPARNNLYWRWPDQICQASSFIAPAITGIALVDGLPRSDCEAVNYGFAAYEIRSNRERNQLRTNPDALCQVVRAEGFSRVIVIDSDSNQRVVVERRKCQ